MLRISCTRQGSAIHEHDGKSLRRPQSRTPATEKPCLLLQPCILYKNDLKGPEQDLFTAAAALFQLTGDVEYRNDADTKWWDPTGGIDSVYYNWNNVWQLGVAVLASAPEPAAKPALSRKFYRTKLADFVGRWATCSNEGKLADECRCAHERVLLVQMQACQVAATMQGPAMRSSLLPSVRMSSAVRLPAKTSSSAARMRPMRSDPARAWSTVI